MSKNKTSIKRRDCVNWSNNDHCARFGGITCPKNCGEYRRYCAFDDLKTDRLQAKVEELEAELERIRAAALSAPPRNCDRFRTAAEAVDAFYGWGGDTDCACGHDFVDWLFARAKKVPNGK